MEHRPVGARRIRWKLALLAGFAACAILLFLGISRGPDEPEGAQSEWDPPPKAELAGHSAQLIGRPPSEAPDEAVVSEAVTVPGPLVLPKVSPFLRVFDGVPPDHYTSFRLQLKLQRYAERETNSAKRLAARRQIERLKQMREDYGPQHTWRRGK